MTALSLPFRLPGGASLYPASTESGFFLFAAMQATFFQTTVNQLLLDNRHQVADDIVQHQT
jgi:hypothetical protein